MNDDSTQIGLWGGPGSGKTTYLASLKIASLLQGSGDWYVYGDDNKFAGSVKFLAEATRQLRHGQFPSSTLSAESHAYRVKGELNSDLFSRVLASFSSSNMNLVLYTKDYPGGRFDTPDREDEIWSYFAGCKGIVYLYDYGQEEDSAMYNFDYVQYLIDFLLLREDVEKINGRLPHYLAVCLSKYDGVDTMEKLKKMPNMLEVDNRDTRQTPHIRDPKKAFESLADKLVVEAIQRNFLPARVKYFTTSSIGFYAPRDGNIDLSDYNNIVPSKESDTIRSGRYLTPINVIEPLIWIESNSRKQSK